MSAFDSTIHGVGDAAPVTRRVPSGLTAAELRVLGCLLEKQSTTPDAYPLSLNALRLACNQATNRDPVVDYDEATVREAAQHLGRRGLARLASGSSSRAVKYRHLLADALPLDAGEKALLAVLLLRGAQTPGELKQRTERMHDFALLGELHDALESMSARGLVRALERRPGQKETRYVQLLGEEEPAALAPAPAAGDDLARRVTALEEEVARLRALLEPEVAA
ncbi:MAG TPA: YceH family protein [Solirubrobacteraceae bacterium]|nr:YceH family protein [Solirubrobacteraceae bacterium]